MKHLTEKEDKIFNEALKDSVKILDIPTKIKITKGINSYRLSYGMFGKIVITHNDGASLELSQEELFDVLDCLFVREYGR